MRLDMRFLAGLILVLACTGCGLLPSPGIEFRTYPIEAISTDEGIELVRTVTTRFLTERFGGVSITWDEELRNLKADDIYDVSNRKLTLYIHIAPRPGGGVDVEMMALVESLTSGKPGQVYGIPQQDVYFEELLHNAMLAEYLERRGTGS